MQETFLPTAFVVLSYSHVAATQMKTKVGYSDDLNILHEHSSPWKGRRSDTHFLFDEESQYWYERVAFWIVL